MKRTLLVAIIIVILGGMGAATAQQALTPEKALERLFVAEELQADWFTPLILSQVPLSQLQGLVNDIKASFGHFVAVEPDQPAGLQFKLVLERAIIPTQIAVQPDGAIAGIYFLPPQPRSSAPSELLAQFEALPGEASFIVMRDGSTLAEFNPDRPLAVGSAFKLSVLKALIDRIEAGELAWESVVQLQPEWKSIPSGILQDWPDGSHLTIQTLATLMISISDNTATDSLIHLVGRERIEAESPRNTPFLTTREATALKNPANAEVLEAYRQGDAAARRQLIDEIAKLPLPGAEVFTGGPMATDIEWFMSARELCSHMAAVQHLPLMAVNPGVANPSEWQHVAFKGGSEPGVLNLTTWLVDQDGSNYCVSATWNDADVLDEMLFFGLYQALIANLRD